MLWLLTHYLTTFLVLLFSHTDLTQSPLSTVHVFPWFSVKVTEVERELCTAGDFLIFRIPSTLVCSTSNSTADEYKQRVPQAQCSNTEWRSLTTSLFSMCFPLAKTLKSQSVANYQEYHVTRECTEKLVPTTVMAWHCGMDRNQQELLRYVKDQDLWRSMAAHATGHGTWWWWSIGLGRTCERLAQKVTVSRDYAANDEETYAKTEDRRHKCNETEPCNTLPVIIVVNYVNQILVESVTRETAKQNEDW